MLERYYTAAKCWSGVAFFYHHYFVLHSALLRISYIQSQELAEAVAIRMCVYYIYMYIYIALIASKAG